ncbi:MAG: response regulator [Rhodobacteraceae bacterium]|nr:response regulator [Paracoccaceae bacterium]
MHESRKVGTARLLATRIWAFVWIGLGLLLPGLMIPQPTVALGFMVSASTVFAVALLVSVVNRRYLASPEHFHDSLDVFVHFDSTPTFFATDDGEITYANQSARKRFGDVENRALVRILTGLSANPVNVAYRLQARALKNRSAHEDIVTDGGHLRLSVHQIVPGGFVWRLEDLVERPATAADAPEQVGMPMLIANDEGRILHMNRALQVMVGGKTDHLDRLFTDLPLRPDGISQITTRSGNQLVRVTEHIRSNGRRELFFMQAKGPESGGILTRDRMFDDMPVALVSLTPDGEIRDANRLARGLLALPPNGGGCFSGLVKGLGRPVADWLRDAAEGRGPKRGEVVQAARKDRDVYLQITLSRVIENGKPGLLAVLNDATELKTLEAQFVQSQKMQAIGQLAGGVAHDFNNLLTAITGYCDLLLLRHDEGDQDYADLVQINQNANRAASLVNQLLAFSRKQNLRPEHLDLRDTLSDLSHLLNRLLGEKVTLRVENGADLAQIRADRRQLEQVLMNLVVNARDAMPGGGEVRIETKNLHLDQEFHRDQAVVAPGDYVSITVHDTGSGIAGDKLSKIFEPFYTTKKTGEGTGLGLSMVYGIVKQTGGFIFVDSVPGEGSNFQILLPADASPAKLETIASLPTAPAAVAAREDGVVLLVEDEAPVRAFAARALRMRGYEVLEAGNAEEALEMLKDSELAVDVFVTDVVMPGKDGPTWVREAQLARPGVKVVFVSGYAEETINDEQSRIANSVFLPKPFSLQDLTEKVREQIAC